MIKTTKRILRHMLIPHRGNSFRPHATRHKSLSIYLLTVMFVQILLGITLYSGPEVKGIDTTKVSQDIINLSNNERSSLGISELYVNETLNQAAEKKLDDMFSKNYWDHIGPGGETAWEFIAEEGYQYEVAGENLARGFKDADAVLGAWMNSPTHKENILNTRFQEIGISIGSGKIKGATTTVIVQLFGRPQTAFASAKQTEQSTIGTSNTLMPQFNIDNATSPSKIPYFIVWTFIFALVVLDGVMIKKLGLHTSSKHIMQFRVALFMSVAMLALLSFGFVAIA